MNIPAERLFWSVVDAPGAGGRCGSVPAGVWPLIEDDLPVKPELMWAVGTPIEGQRLLVCAALRRDLEVVNSDDGTLTPDRVPETFALSVDPAQLNLLVGLFEPHSLRRARRNRRLFAAVAALVSAALIGVGLERRAGVWHRETRDMDTATQSVLASLAPTPGWTTDDMAMELVQRRGTDTVAFNAPGDAALAVAALLACWPTHVLSKPQSMVASGDTASVSVLVPDNAAAFIAALKPPEGWKLEEPRLVSVDKATRVNLELRRVTP